MRRRRPDREILSELAFAKVAVIAVDQSDRVIVCNDLARGMTEYLSNELLGKSSSILWSRVPTQNPQVTTTVCPNQCGLLERARKNEVVPPHTTLIITKSGAIRWVNVTHLGVPSMQGGLIVVHVLWDLSATLQDHHEIIHRLEYIVPLIQYRNKWPNATFSDEPVLKLRPREVQILTLLSQGSSTDEIAEALTISPVTVRNHIQRALLTLGARNRLEAVAEAHRLGYV